MPERLRDGADVYALIALLLLTACAEEATPAPPAPGGGGAGAGGAAGCADLSADGACRFQGFDGGCAEGEVCTIAPFASCGDAPCCTLAPTCTAPTGARPGGVACEDDGDCASGLCVRLGGAGSCLRPCTVGAAVDSCPDGLVCATVALDGQRSVRTCVGDGGGGAFDPLRTLCRHDGECAQERYCRVAEGERFREGAAHGLCEVGARTGETGQLCAEVTTPGPDMDPLGGPAFSALCPEGGLCVRPCYDASSYACRCDGAACRQFVCTQPCGADAECPSPLVCRLLEEKRFDHYDHERAFKLCVFPPENGIDWACWDEEDCCAGGLTREGRTCCDQNDGGCVEAPLDDTVCRVTRTGARWTSRCEPPAGLAIEGGACADHAACASGLCGPDGRCTSPCRAGSGDRCDAILPGTQCCPMQVGEACVTACRADCATGPGCAP